MSTTNSVEWLVHFMVYRFQQILLAGGGFGCCSGKCSDAKNLSGDHLYNIIALFSMLNVCSVLRMKIFIFKL